jgi:DNA-binding CsgD family transcriptional regulator/tetratricopeptide (TPR) repeat protein
VHHSEIDDVAAFFDSAARESSVLLIEGEPGIGKTTRWLAVLDEARARGLRILRARPTESESQLAWTTLADLLADLLGDMGEELYEELPAAQRLAVDRVLSRAASHDAATDPTTTAAAFLSLVRTLSEAGPVLLALDDLQWVDVSSSRAIASVSRRLPANVSVLGTVRAGHRGDAGSWLQPARPSAIRRLLVTPMSGVDLERLVTDRIGRRLSRSAWQHVERVSQGNPFLALELARSIDTDPGEAGHRLPDTLADVVRTRIGDADDDVRRALLAIAALAEPTVELVHRAVETGGEHFLQILEEAERRGLIEIEGNRLRFTHPLLAAGVYTGTDAATRRAMHRRLAALVTGDEPRARHLALAAVRGDAETLDALDHAARVARVRGAPAAAAELIQLALRLGGDEPERRLRLGQHLLDAGDKQPARAVLEESLARLPPGPLRARTASTLARVRLESDSFVEAAAVLESALSDTETDLRLRVEILTQLSYALLNAGQPDAALRRAEDAVKQGERLGQSHLLGLALAMQLMIRFLRGEGLDEATLGRALTLEDPDPEGPMAMRPSTTAALFHAWTGRLDQAAEELAVIRGRCVELGEESAFVFVDFHAVMVHCWRADFSEATRMSQEARRLGDQLGGEVPDAVALSLSAMVAAFGGRADEARRDATKALAGFQRAGMLTLTVTPMSTLGFLEVSLGDHEAALTVLAPLLAQVEARPEAVEIVTAAFLPDAIEAMVVLGRLEQAEPLAGILQGAGQRLDRAWLLAVGHRCRSLLEAAHGDLAAAQAWAERAMAEHDRLAMPFERARTQLLLGQIQRRLRLKEAAASTLAEALAAFEVMGTPLWAARCRAEVARVGSGRRTTSLLTPSERRVAELAATGMTNRAVAAALFISPKTVESNLAKVYRKLDIRSRAELGTRMSQPGVGAAQEG